MIVEELWGQLELEDALAAAARARRDLRRLVLVADPERVLHAALLLRVAQDLAGLLRGDNVEELELGTDLG